MDKKEFPEEFWRGIANKDFVKDGYVLPSAFQFDNDIREDGFKELSINWNDDDEALKKILEQRKENGKIQFSVGAANLNLSRVKQLLSMYIDRKQFSYERKELEDNEYHGNLLVLGTLDKQLRLMISSCLAVAADTSITYQK